MRFIEITDKKILDNFVATHGGDFLQSWDWGEFQKSVGNEVERLGVVGTRHGVSVLGNDELLAAVTLIKKTLPLSYAYWFAPRGPVINFKIKISNFKTISNFLMTELKLRARRENLVFLRFEPPISDRLPEFYYWKEFVIYKNISKTIDLEPKQTAMLDLTKNGAELLQAMHQKTRYNIRLAEKRGVEVFKADQRYFDDWWRLLQETGSRDGFRLHTKTYYEKMMNLGLMTLYLAKSQGVVLAGILVSRFGDRATYVHGASGNEGRNLMAPYLLQRQAIQEAATDGYRYYDFYGVDKVKWPGVTRFKDGFGGQNLAYLGTFDLVFNRGYYNIYELGRKLVRTINNLKSKI